MEISVPPQVTNELRQILSNLVLGDNEIRSNAEKVVNERLSQTPELYILALAQFASTASEDMRSFSLILLRRLLFRTVQIAPNAPIVGPGHNQHGQSLTMYDHLSESTRVQLENTLLNSLLNEPSASVKHKAADTITDLANASFQRGRPWPALQQTVFRAVGGNASARESAYRIMERCAVLMADVPPEVLYRGLGDNSIDSRLAALKATVAYLSHEPRAPALLSEALRILPSTPFSHLTRFLNALTPLATSHPSLFGQHLPALLTFLPSLVLGIRDYDPGPTPTVARPFPVNGSGSGGSPGSGSSSIGSNTSPRGSAFLFPPPQNLGGGGHAGNGYGASAGSDGGGAENEDEDEEDEEREEARRAALEFMVSLSESKPGMVRKVDGWVAIIVRACLEGMGEILDTQEEMNRWLDADPSDDPTEQNYPQVFEQALDRLSLAMNGKPVLQVAFQYIPAMLASHDWRLKHAGLMAIASLAEGGAKVMINELATVVKFVTMMFSDPHPRVVYAACQCIGQLCTDLEEVIQERHHQEIFAVLIPTLETPVSRVHAHAAAALINFCEGVERDTLIPYLDPIVERLLKLLNPVESPGGKVRGYVQEQAITTLAMVADASEKTFAKHYSVIMPLLLNVLRNANVVEHRKLRWKAMECAGLIAIAVGQDVFRQDAPQFIEQLMRIQNSPIDPSDTLLNHYLIATWAKFCQAMSSDFEPYLPIVMPPLLQTATAKADVSVWDDDDQEKIEDREGWETVSLDGQQVGIKTSVIEEKCQAFETLVIYCSTLGPRFAPYLSQTLELVLPALRFMFHDGVREASAMLIPMLLVCGKNSNTLTPQMVSAIFSQMINVLADESDPSFLASLFKCLTDSVRVVGGPDALTPEFREGILTATRNQLQMLAEKRKARSQRSEHELEDDKEDLALIEELEDFALEDMGKMLRYFDPNHPLMIAISSVRELSIRTDEWESDGGESES